MTLLEQHWTTYTSASWNHRPPLPTSHTLTGALPRPSGCPASPLPASSSCSPWAPPFPGTLLSKVLASALSRSPKVSSSTRGFNYHLEAHDRLSSAGLSGARDPYMEQLVNVSRRKPHGVSTSTCASASTCAHLTDRIGNTGRSRPSHRGHHLSEHLEIRTRPLAPLSPSPSRLPPSV